MAGRILKFTTFYQVSQVQTLVSAQQGKKNILGTMMNKVSDAKIGNYGIYYERKYYDDNNPKGSIRKVPKEYIFRITEETSRAPGRYGDRKFRRLFVEFIGDHPYDVNTATGANNFIPMQHGLITETPSHGWKLYKQIQTNPLKGEMIEFYEQ